VNPTLLIHAIVRQTMVLIAVLATAAGRRTPLANIADEIFATLVTELGEQGVSHKVIADMLGIALRTYHRRTARLAESDTEKGRTLWEAVLSYLRQRESVLRNEVLVRFPLDNEAVVRSVLRDLVDSGLVYQTGRGDSTSYRAADPAHLSAEDASRASEQLLLVAIHQSGPLTAAELRAMMPLDEKAVATSLAHMVDEKLVVCEGAGEDAVYRCEDVSIPLGAAAGWEAAVFDHFQAMVTALVTKLRVGVPRSDLADKIGGSTFTFDVWPSHPLSARVLGYLQSMREHGLSLRAEIDNVARSVAKPDREPWVRVTAYVGQVVREDEDDDDARG
jgi:hypothetical protein